MRVQRIAWLGVRTDAYEATVGFLRDVLGLRVAFQEPTTAELALPNDDRVQVFGPGDRYRAGRPTRLRWRLVVGARPRTRRQPVRLCQPPIRPLRNATNLEIVRCGGLDRGRRTNRESRVTAPTGGRSSKPGGQARGWASQDCGFRWSSASAARRWLGVQPVPSADPCDGCWAALATGLMDAQPALAASAATSTRAIRNSSCRITDLSSRTEIFQLLNLLRSIQPSAAVPSAVFWVSRPSWSSRRDEASRDRVVSAGSGRALPDRDSREL